MSKPQRRPIPPAPQERDLSRAADPSLVGTADAQASGTVASPQAGHRPEPPVQRTEGGQP